jgi:hypothetical protein
LVSFQSKLDRRPVLITISVWPPASGTKLRIVKTDPFPYAPRLRIFFTIDEDDECTMRFIELLEGPAAEEDLVTKTHYRATVVEVVASGTTIHLVTARRRRKSDALVLAERFATDPAVQAIMASGTSLLGILLPPAGVAVAGLSTLATAAIGRRAQVATAALLEGLQARLEVLEAAERLRRPEDQADWDLAAHKAVFANAQDPGKTADYADLLAGALSSDAPADLDIDALLTAVRDLPLGAIQIAREMFEYHRDHPGQHKQIPSNIGGEDRQLYMNRLEATGLVERFFASRPIGSPGFTGEYVVTPSLIRLVQTLEASRVSEKRERGPSKQ